MITNRYSLYDNMDNTLPLSAGYILQNEFMVPLHISDYQLAQETGVAQITINQIVNNKRKITPDVAIRLSRFFGNSAEFWLNLQIIHDLKLALKKNAVVYSRIKPFEYQTSRK